ncbi:MAG: prealbumin-like fold domain-containing protein, partial [Angelakisella sp.]
MAWVKIATKTTDTDGAVSFGSLPYGNYQFQQTSAKTGYTAVGTPVPVTISSATTVQENLANTPAAVGTLQI